MQSSAYFPVRKSKVLFWKYDRISGKWLLQLNVPKHILQCHLVALWNSYLNSWKKTVEYAKEVLNSPPNSETHTIKKEHSHNKNENFKTMYRSCENANDDDPVTEALEILRAVTKKIKREHTDSSYRNGDKNSLSFYKKRSIKVSILKNSTLDEKPWI